MLLRAGLAVWACLLRSGLGSVLHMLTTMRTQLWRRRQTVRQTVSQQATGLVAAGGATGRQQQQRQPWHGGRGGRQLQGPMPTSRCVCVTQHSTPSCFSSRVLMQLRLLL